MPFPSDIPSRFPFDRPLEDDTGIWWVLQCRPNRERRMAKYLLQREISYYLPLYNRQIKIGASRRESIIKAPLFKGYLCFALDRNKHNLLYETHDFARILQIRDQDTFVAELQSVSKVIKTEQDLLVKPGLLRGRRALIVSGPLKGLEGVIVRHAKSGQFAITVEMFNRTVILNVNPFTDLQILR